MEIAFISGHLDLSDDEFFLHYKSKIDEAIDKKHHFVIGDAKGADSMAQRYLSISDELLSYVTVYHMAELPRFIYGNFKLKGGYKSDNERDEAMTLNSTYDIAWVRPGREKSGTAKNLKRRKV